MIAALLPRIATDLAVSLQAAGQLVTIFALTYAVSSPFLTALTGGINRRKLLIGSMVAFTLANLVAARATGYASLAWARVLLAGAAGLYVPNAAALAGAMVPAERRGRALAIVTGGISLAVALGVPLGALIGGRFGWRMTFVGVAVLGAAALAGLLIGIPRSAGSGIAAAGLRDRLALVRQPAVFATLSITTLWAAGAYTVYTYIAPFLASVAGVGASAIGYVLFLFGAAAFSGLLLSGLATDRFGSRRVISTSLPLLAIALVSFSLSARYLVPSAALGPILAALVLWGVAGWSFFPAQQNRLIAMVGLKGASVVLSLNASFQYLGFSIGAGLGSLVLSRGGVADLGWVGALCVAAALVLHRLCGSQVGDLACKPPR